jgi:hypothetical protein
MACTAAADAELWQNAGLQACIPHTRAPPPPTHLQQRSCQAEELALPHAQVVASLLQAGAAEPAASGECGCTSGAKEQRHEQASMQPASEGKGAHPQL